MIPATSTKNKYRVQSTVLGGREFTRSSYRTYTYCAINKWPNEKEDAYFATWHSRYDLAMRGHGYGSVVVEVIQILPDPRSSNDR